MKTLATLITLALLSSAAYAGTPQENACTAQMRAQNDRANMFNYSCTDMGRPMAYNSSYWFYSAREAEQKKDSR